MHEVTLQSLQQLWCRYMLAARSKWCMKWGNLIGTSLECLEKAMHGAVLFSFPTACFILINFSCQNENSFHSELEMALFEKNLEKRGASVFPWFLSGSRTLLGALSTWWPPGCECCVLAWTGWLVAHPNVGTNRLAAIVGVRCFVAVF